MLSTRFAASIISVGLLIPGANQVFAQTYPTKPIRILTQEPGGGNDFAARLIAQGLTGALGQPVIVENRPRTIAVENVAKASPDGYSLLLGGAGMWLAPYLRNNVSWDPLKDFAPVSWTTVAPNILVVHPSLPAKSVKELIALAKAKPGGLNYASGTGGGSPQLAGELFKAMAGVNIVGVPFQGTGPSLNSLIGGEVQLMFPTAGAVVPHVKAGRLRALAIGSTQPSALYPDLPTVAASGLPGYQSVAMIGISAPAKTPVAIIRQLNQEIVRVVNRTDVKEKFLNVGVETVGSSPEQFAAAIRSEMGTLGKLIKDLGIRESP